MIEPARKSPGPSTSWSARELQADTATYHTGRGASAGPGDSAAEAGRRAREGLLRQELVQKVEGSDGRLSADYTDIKNNPKSIEHFVSLSKVLEDFLNAVAVFEGTTIFIRPIEDIPKLDWSQVLRSTLSEKDYLSNSLLSTLDTHLLHQHTEQHRCQTIQITKHLLLPVPVQQVQGARDYRHCCRLSALRSGVLLELRRATAC